MMGFWLLIPFFLLRFGLLSLLDREAVARAAHFAPLLRREKPAYWIYQISNVAILISIIFLKISFTPPLLFAAGAAVYAAGTILLAASVVCFAAPAPDGLRRGGLYRLSRNPMYVAYFIFFTGCALLAQSIPLMLFVVVFQLSAHWIILAEERWCGERFGEAYLQYTKQVRRYL